VKWHDHVKNSDIADTTRLPNDNDIISKRLLALFGQVTPTHQLTRHWNRPWMSSPGTDLMSNGGDLLDDHATPGYSRLTTAHWQASDSPGELQDRGHCGSLLRASAAYDDDMMIMMIFSLCLSSLNPARESGWAVKSTGFLHTLKVILGNNGSFCSSVPGSPFMSPRTGFLLLKS